MLEGAEKFFDVYSNLPLEERKKTIIVIDKEPLSWNLAYEEIKNETPRGAKILRTLKELRFI
ncbi:MAG TPA: hypothetical protein VJJ75_02840 [Candidatus Nanoarchaeia archaeon]|nr:hypothetical protein [Candidatus Nanoarchaeia archaeon]